MKLIAFYEHITEAARQTGRPLEELMPILRESGIDGVDFPVRPGIDYDTAKAQLDKAGLAVLSLHKDCDFTHDPDWTKAKDLIDLAEKWNVKPVLVVPGFVPNEAGEEERAEANEKILASLKPLCAYAETKGVTVTLEDFDGKKAPFATMHKLRWFLDRVPQLGISFDTGNFFFWDEDEQEAFRLLEDRIVHMHCKDRAVKAGPGEEQVSVGGTRMYPVSVGGGVMHIREILGELVKKGYDGALTIEHFGSADQLGDLQKSAQWLTMTLNELKK